MTAGDDYDRNIVWRLDVVQMFSESKTEFSYPKDYLKSDCVLSIWETMVVHRSSLGGDMIAERGRHKSTRFSYQEGGFLHAGWLWGLERNKPVIDDSFGNLLF